VLQPYSPVFSGVAIAALGLAGRSLFRSTAACRVEAGELQGGRRSRTFRKAIFWVVAGLTAILLLTPVAAPWFY
jgi:mercuric ion transport protein